MFTTEYKGLRMLVQRQAKQQFPRAKQKPILGIEMWTVSFVPWIWIHKWGVKHLFFFFFFSTDNNREEMNHQYYCQVQYEYVNK